MLLQYHAILNQYQKEALQLSGFVQSNLLLIYSVLFPLVTLKRPPTKPKTYNFFFKSEHGSGDYGKYTYPSVANKT